MKPMMDQNSIRMTLREAVKKGRFTIEDLDEPSPGFRKCKDEYLIKNPLSNGTWKGIQFKNLLRDPEAEQERPF